MHSIAHIVNIFSPSETSDLILAQEVTLASMIRAKYSSRSLKSIELLSAQTQEDLHMVPKEFKATESLTRDVTDLHSFGKKIHLPILSDILDRAYEGSDAEYLIYSNIDIGVQPNFYDAVNRFIDQGHDAFMINRRRIPEKFSSVDELDLMLAEKGYSHPGFDCFVFKRELYPKFSLANVCIGVPFIEITFSQNLFCFAERPMVFMREYLTFHIGLEVFKERAAKEYFEYNREQFWAAMKPIWNELDSRKWTFGTDWLPFRYFFWGIHPCFPTRLALKLEPRRWFRRSAR
jgi:hypothetical protein